MTVIGYLTNERPIIVEYIGESMKHAEIEKVMFTGGIRLQLVTDKNIIKQLKERI